MEELGLGHPVLLRLLQEVADVDLFALGSLPRDGVLGDTARHHTIH